ncbi:hypothetical protein IFM89_003736 [Coptis chinensis]|uniref:Myb/SANT-like DNA-binding domain-containing protein n=1 Tax=Coptis chinensis TaxID=261450 RepID=A0A835I0R9_9MAGN|nr:hypothetical protein IFM89_003736 [Coptis chinensis]
MSQPSSSSAPPQEQKTPTNIIPQLQFSTSIPKKTQPLPWTHLETVNLIEAYQEKWYSLKRGQLKASQWEEVANAVATRCGFKELSKSATQCRHKMEKLRKRYRTEKQRPYPSVWAYFDMMDFMERGPFPISARPSPVSMVQLIGSGQGRVVSRSSDEEEDDDEEENEEEDGINMNSNSSNSNKSRSINHIVRRPPMASPIFDALPLPPRWNGSGGGRAGGGDGVGVSRFLRNPMFRKRKRSFEVDDVGEEEEEEEVEEDSGRLLSELASVVRAFGEGFVRVENMKLEMMKETEKQRIEMEKKRMEMILESQRSIVDTITRTFDLHKKPEKTEEHKKSEKTEETTLI